jgi:hypothetical protein
MIEIGDTVEVRDWENRFCGKGVVVCQPGMYGDLVVKTTQKSEHYRRPPLQNRKGYYDFDNRFNHINTRVVLTEKRNLTFKAM